MGNVSLSTNFIFHIFTFGLNVWSLSMYAHFYVACIWRAIRFMMKKLYHLRMFLDAISLSHANWFHMLYRRSPVCTMFACRKLHWKKKLSWCNKGRLRRSHKNEAEKNRVTPRTKRHRATWTLNDRGNFRRKFFRWFSKKMKKTPQKQKKRQRKLLFLFLFPSIPTAAEQQQQRQERKKFFFGATALPSEFQFHIHNKLNQSLKR